MTTGVVAAEVLVADQPSATIASCLPVEQSTSAMQAAAHDAPPPSAAELEHCDPWRLLSGSEPSPGMHVLCALPGDSGDYRLAVFADGWAGGAAPASRPAPQVSLHVSAGEVGGVKGMALLVMERLQVPTRGPRHNSPAIFTPLGAELHSAAEVRTRVTLARRQAVRFGRVLTHCMPGVPASRCWALAACFSSRGACGCGRRSRRDTRASC